MSTSGNLMALCTGLIVASSMSLWYDDFQAFLGGVIGVCSYVMVAELILWFKNLFRGN